MASTSTHRIVLTAIVSMAIAGYLALGVARRYESSRIDPEAAFTLSAGYTPLQVQIAPSFCSGLVGNDRIVRGVAIGGMVYQKEIHGLSFSLMNALVEKKSGLSFSLLENSVDSSGLALFAAGGVERNNGVTVGFWNLAEHNRGLQFGLVNQVYPQAVNDSPLKTMQTPQGFGVQAGVVNYSEGRGVQLGLWNTNPNSFFHYFPIINFAF